MVKWRDTFEKDLSLLLEKVCVKHGFCNATRSVSDIANPQAISALEFADFVLSSEGLNPEYEKEWRKTLSAEFIGWFNRESVSSTDYAKSS